MKKRPQIEHPRSIGIGNKKILDAITIAYQVALDLASQGFSVKCITSDTDRPKLWLHPTGICNKLASTIKTHGQDQKGKYKMHAASIDGCEINWIIRRAA